MLLYCCNPQMLIWKVVQQIFHCWHDILIDLNSKCDKPIFQRLIFLLRFPIGLFFSLGAHKSNHWNCTLWLWWTKQACLRICLKILWLILDEMAGVGLLRLQFLSHCQFFPLWTLFFPFVLHWLLLYFPNMHDLPRGTSSFNYINIHGRTPSPAILNIYLGWRWDDMSFLDFNYCCKCGSTSGNMILPIFLVWDSLISLYNPQRGL